MNEKVIELESKWSSINKNLNYRPLQRGNNNIDNDLQMLFTRIVSKKAKL